MLLQVDLFIYYRLLKMVQSPLMVTVGASLNLSCSQVLYS